jgi:hypothetical protein
MEIQLVGSQSLPAIPEFIADWHSWSPHLRLPEPSALAKRCQDACGYAEASGIILVHRKNAGNLAKLSWKGIDTVVRERCVDLVKGFGVDGHLMRAHLNLLYPSSFQYSLWERLFSENATITVRSQLMENVRILLFYVTVLSFLGNNAEAERLKSFLDLAGDGFLPLGVARRSQRLLMVTG